MRESSDPLEPPWLPCFEPIVVHASRTAPGLSRNFGSGTGAERDSASVGNETDDIAVEVGGSIVTGFAMTGDATTGLVTIGCPIIGTP